MTEKILSREDRIFPTFLHIAQKLLMQRGKKQVFQFFFEQNVKIRTCFLHVRTFIISTF